MEIGLTLSGGFALGPRGPGVAAMVVRGPRVAPDPSVAAPEFQTRYAAHAEQVERLCRRLLGPGPAAEDAAQECFLRAQRGEASYDPAQPFRPWLLALVSHHCIDVLRRRSREGRLFSAADLEAGDLGDPGPSPLAVALDAEQRARLLGAIDALPDKYRVPLVLRYFQELDYASLAEALDVTRDHVGVLLFRARRQLRAAFEEGEA